MATTFPQLESATTNIRTVLVGVASSSSSDAVVVIERTTFTTTTTNALGAQIITVVTVVYSNTLEGSINPPEGPPTPSGNSGPPEGPTTLSGNSGPPEGPTTLSDTGNPRGGATTLSPFESSTQKTTLTHSSSPKHTSSPTVATAAAHGLSSKNESNGLSTGAAIGIGIGIAVAVIALLLLLGFFCYRRRKRRKREGINTSAPGSHDTPSSGEVVSAKRKVMEASEHRSPYELSGRSRAGELETNANRHELDAYRRGERVHEIPGEHGERKIFDRSQQ